MTTIDFHMYAFMGVWHAPKECNVRLRRNATGGNNLSISSNEVCSDCFSYRLE